MRHTNKIGWVTVLLIATTGASMAQSIDPPARAARLNYLSGQVSFRPDAVEDWAAASLNYPLTPATTSGPIRERRPKCTLAPRPSAWVRKPRWRS